MSEAFYFRRFHEKSGLTTAFLGVEGCLYEAQYFAGKSGQVDGRRLRKIPWEWLRLECALAANEAAGFAALHRFNERFGLGGYHVYRGDEDVTDRESLEAFHRRLGHKLPEESSP